MECECEIHRAARAATASGQATTGAAFLANLAENLPLPLQKRIKNRAMTASERKAKTRTDPEKYSEQMLRFLKLTVRA